MTRNTLAIAGAGLVLAAAPVGTPAALAQSGESAVAPAASEYSPIQRYAITFDRPRDLAEFYLEQSYEISPRAAEITELAHPSDASMRVVLVTVDGLLDDSVQAIQLRIAMKVDAGNWGAVEAGVRRKCARGDNAGNWQKAVCP